MFRKFRPSMLQNQVLHLRGKKDGKQDKSKQQKPECLCICPPHYKILTMDDMQLPYGNWKEQYQKRNRKYNSIFLFGLISLIGSITVLNKSCIFFNAFPPPYPFDKEDIFECADDDEDCEFECECEC
ncbi:uncharacterized protein LOC100575941 [Acyrthosiphon pisum]|uniref:Deltamethrin resistance protein prag01 domain-containing protein n=1 Tax=Acyrthosiphon pisum TaxID=7029 RepID=A0A8R1W6D7_ACYPI|nr:uncharacterized protein LOC100575941 [Acyrthosiphon pisum]|eukprot:XP_003245945.1 PREDICTED: uncharacterized protein LOC100575941 [Acyrthosiphon pisum]